MWEMIVVGLGIVVLLVMSLVQQTRSAGGYKSDVKARKTQQKQADAADKIQASPLRRGADLIRWLRQLAKRR